MARVSLSGALTVHSRGPCGAQQSFNDFYPRKIILAVNKDCVHLMRRPNMTTRFTMVCALCQWLRVRLLSAPRCVFHLSTRG